VNVGGIQDLEQRVEVMARRAEFDEDPAEFSKKWRESSKELEKLTERALSLYPKVSAPRSVCVEIARFCLDVGVDGHRGDIIMLKTAKTHAAYHGRKEVTAEDIEVAAELVLPHRVRRQPFQEIPPDVKSMRGSTSL
jgi:magnesium chelatase subunit I